MVLVSSITKLIFLVTAMELKDFQLSSGAETVTYVRVINFLEQFKIHRITSQQTSIEVFTLKKNRQMTPE